MSEQFEEMVYENDKEVIHITKIYTYRSGKKVIKKETVHEFH